MPILAILFIGGDIFLKANGVGYGHKGGQFP